jgi:hypothetical protein
MSVFQVFVDPSGQISGIMNRLYTDSLLPDASQLIIHLSFDSICSLAADNVIKQPTKLS